MVALFGVDDAAVVQMQEDGGLGEPFMGGGQPHSHNRTVEINLAFTPSASYTFPMPSPVRFSEVKRMMEDMGYHLKRVNGSHHIFEKSGVGHESIPVHGGKVKFNYVRKIKKLASEIH